MYNSYRALSVGITASMGVAVELRQGYDLGSLLKSDTYTSSYGGFDTNNILDQFFTSYDAKYKKASEELPSHNAYKKPETQFESYSRPNPDYAGDLYEQKDYDPYVSGYFGDYERSHGYTAYNTLEDYDHHSYKGSGFGDYAGNYLHGKHYGNKSYTADHRQDFAAASVSYKSSSSSKSASSSTEEAEVEEEAGDKPLYVFPGKDYGDADPMPKGFNYGAYKRFNSAPHYHEREKRNNIPVRDSSSDGHRSADSHLSYTTSDEDGVYSDSDNGFNVGGAPVVREGNMIFSRRPAELQDPHHIAANFEFDSKSDNDDGFTDSIYRFSNSTSDRGEITDPATDSAIHSPEERDFFYDHDVHGPHGTGHPGVTTITKGTPDAYDYSNLHDALWTLDRKIGNKGGIDDHKFYFRDDFKPFEGDKWGHMAFSPEWEECVDCIPGHPGHRHHVLDHPDDPNSPDHDHTTLVDDLGWPVAKPLHNHDKP